MCGLIFFCSQWPRGTRLLWTVNFWELFYLLRGGVYCCFLVFFLIVCFLFSLIFIKRFQSFFIFACLVSVSWYSSSQEPSYIRGSWVQVSHQMHTSPPCLLTCEHFGRRQNFKSKSCNSWIRLLLKVLPDFLEKKTVASGKHLLNSTTGSLKFIAKSLAVLMLFLKLRYNY